MSIVIEDFAPYYIGKCCSRSCYYITKLQRMEFCPYCSGELKLVYDYFAIFDLNEERINGWRDTFSDNKLKTKYKELSLRFHPDKHPDGDEAFLLLGAARTALATASRRSMYENLLQRALYSLRMLEEADDFTNEEEPIETGEDNFGHLKDSFTGKKKEIKLFYGKLHMGLLLLSLIVASLLILNFLLTQNYFMVFIFAVVAFVFLTGFRQLLRIYGVLISCGLFGIFVYALLWSSRLNAALTFLGFSAFLYLCQQVGRKNAMKQNKKDEQQFAEEKTAEEKTAEVNRGAENGKGNVGVA